MLVTVSVSTEAVNEPYVGIYGSHHAFLGLLDSHFEALCLAVAGHRGRGMADGAVRIHPDDGLAPLCISGVHLSKGYLWVSETVVCCVVLSASRKAVRGAIERGLVFQEETGV